MTTQRSQATSNASYGEMRRGGFVLALFKRICPFAVAGFISFVVVFSVNAEPILTFTHIRKEVAESLPSLTNFYPSRAVVFELGEFGIGATPHHYSPSPVGFWEFGSASSVSVLDPVSLGTTAGLYVAMPKRIKPVCSDVSALARTPHHWDGIPSFIKFGVRKSSGGNVSELLSCNLGLQDGFRHNKRTVIVVFSGGGQHQLPVAANQFSKTV